MTINENKRKYDLEDRTYNFAKNCRDLIYKLSRNIPNIENSKQLMRSSGSVAANYIEANEALSKKDFIMRIKICRKEAKESRLWLRLCLTENAELDKTRTELTKEAEEITKIYGAILEKCK